jgi:NADH dehydrogenase [ubiquinone] 1 alpha subcomplex assembly factor 3
VEGSILCFGDIWLSWSARSLKDITLDSLQLVDLVKPIPELVVIGCGPTIRKLPERFVRQLDERGINLEVLDTVNAVATFNILNQEGRAVVGALLPAGVETN